MNDNAELYLAVSNPQRRAVVHLLEKEFPYSKFTSVPNQRVLDIGCGPGDTTESVLLPYLPADSQLMGVDILPNMIKHAKENYGSNPRLQFCEYDLECCDADVTDKLGKFDKIFSFWTFHWVRNHEVAFRNVYTLLNPGGEILFLFVGPVSMPNYKEIAQKPQWREYLHDIDTLLAPLNHFSDPCAGVESAAKSAGFQNIHCILQTKSIEFPSFSAISKTMQSTNPILRRIPKHLWESFISDNKTEILKNFCESERGYTVQFKEIILYASK